MMGGLPGVMSMFTDPMRSMGGQGSPGYDRYANVVGQSTQVQTAINQIAQAKAAIAELDENLENAISRAPFDGTVIAKMVEVGDIVQPGMPLVTYADLTQMQIQVQVPSRLINTLNAGAIVNARLDHNDQLEIPVTVAQIFPMAKEGGHTTTVKFDLPAGVPAQTGTYAEVLIPDENSNSSELPMVPESAIVWRGSLPAVFVIDGDNLKMKILRTGSFSGNGMVSVISGLQPGDKVLDNPTPSTRSGAIDPAAAPVNAQ
jgi:RND family efflux transporter MFP subunit